MKNLKIKSVVLAAALAVGLGVTGVAATAQAAEWGVLLEADCDHNLENWKDEISYDTRDNNRFTHTKYTLHLYYCTKCGYITNNGEEAEVEEEPHDLVFSSTGNRWECTCCDYWE